MHLDSLYRTQKLDTVNLDIFCNTLSCRMN
jgi:hypothetical protein